MFQEYSSAKSSIKQIPMGFGIVNKVFGWQPNTVNLDIGGGKYDLMTEKLKEKNVTNLIYDPYNRSEEENNLVLLQSIPCIVDTVTIFNVLNVIKEHENQIEALRLAYKALKCGGYLYVRSTYMNKLKRSAVTKSGTFQHYLTMSDYLLIIREIFPLAQLKYGLIYSIK